MYKTHLAIESILLFFACLFGDRVSLCSHENPGTHSVKQAVLELNGFACLCL